MMKPATPLVIGVAGGSGSGKTTLARSILERVGISNIAYLPHDSYYKDLNLAVYLALGMPWLLAVTR